MKAKFKNVAVGLLSTLMLVAIPTVAATVTDAPVTAFAATSDIAADNNLALNKWDWEVDEIASGVTKFDGDSMYMDGISSVGGPFATYKTNKLNDFKYSMYANMSLTTAHEIEGVDSAKDWDYSTFYISFMINYDGSGGIYPVYARPWDGPAYFSVCFEKLYLEYNYCPTDLRELKSGACPVCGGTDYETKGRLMDVIRVYRNECFDGRGYDRYTIVEKTWYEGCEEDVGKDFDYDGDLDEKDLQATDIGVNYVDGNYHWFDFEVKNNANNNGITINFYYDNVLMFTVGQANTFKAMDNETMTVDFTNTSGYLGFWTDSSFPDLSADRTNCFVDIKQLGIAPISGNAVGGYYEKAPKPDLPINALTYPTQASYPKGEEIEIPLSGLFSYEGDEEIVYTFTDMDTNQTVGEIKNGYWLWTPTKGSMATVQVDAVVQDGTNAKSAQNYLFLNLSGEDINATQLNSPTLTLNGNVASWENVANASGYVYKIGVSGTEQTATSNSVTLTHNQTLYVKATSSSINYLDSSWSNAVTYIATTLDTPVVKLSGTTANWAAVDNAEKYVYKINGGEEKETTNTYVMNLTHGQAIQVKAVGNGNTTLDSNWTHPVTYTADSLNTPVVTLNGNVARWNSISGANGYAYKINGVEQSTTETSVTLTHNQTITVMAKGNNTTNLDSKWSTAVTYIAPALDAPYVEVNGNVASWEDVDGATGYQYRIDGGALQTATKNEVTLENGQSIQVKALGNGETTLDSAWSATATYVAVVLKTPVVQINDGVASWTAVANASGYVYKIGASGAEQSTSATSVTLTHNQTIYVKAIGDGVNYLNSGWSLAKTYNEGALNQPAVTLDGNVASWSAIQGASGYVYKINGVENTTTATQVTLKHGETFKVKAVGDTKEDSFWSNSVSYVAPMLGAPTVTLNGNVASWENVEGASGYAYKIGASGTEQTATGNSVTLTHNQKLYVKAVGDGETALDSAWSVAVTYKASAIVAPVVALNGNVASWSAENNVTYKYSINGGAEQIATDNSVTLTHGDTLVVWAVGNGETTLDSAKSSAVTYTASALNTPTVTLNGNVASWNAENGVTYKYSINGSAGQTTTNSQVTLTHGDTLVVWAVGNGETTLDSAKSNEVTYTASALNAPAVTLNGNVASWENVEGASGYVYKIGANGQEKTATGNSVTLTHSQAIYVKAVGNGETTLDSAWSAVKTYKAPALNAPTVTLNGNVASWENVEGASGYVYSIDGGVAQTATNNSVTLQEGQTIRVKALGNGVDKGDSAWSAEVTYSGTQGDESGDNNDILDGIYDSSYNTKQGCGSVAGTFGVTAILLAAGVCLAIKRRGENKQ